MYFIYLLINMVVGVPEAHISTGVHQTLGPCDVFDKDISGHERQVYLCRYENNTIIQVNQNYIHKNIISINIEFHRINIETLGKIIAKIFRLTVEGDTICQKSYLMMYNRNGILSVERNILITHHLSELLLL